MRGWIYGRRIKDLVNSEMSLAHVLNFIIVWEISPTVIRDVLHRRKLLELWLVQNLEHHVEVC
jgi:hypothetical protein